MGETVRIVRQHWYAFLLIAIIIGLAVRSLVAEPGYASLSRADKTALDTAFLEALKTGPRDASGMPVRDVFERYWYTLGPERMLTHVTSLDPYCHSEGHNIGKAIYDHSQSLGRAVSICTDACTGGCIHGVIAEMVSQEALADADDHSQISLEAIPSGLRNKIAGACTGADVTSVTGMGNCYHGVGHAFFVLAGSDRTEATRFCELLKAEGEGEYFYCLTGVAMEYIDTFGTRATDPCKGSSYSAVCYRYGLGAMYDLRADEHAQARRYCLGLSRPERRGCFHGLGFGSASMLRRKPEAIQNICRSGDSIDTRLCVEGAIERMNMTPRRSFAFCDVVKDDIEACQNPTFLSPANLDRDFSPYLQ